VGYEIPVVDSSLLILLYNLHAHSQVPWDKQIAAKNIS
jgi:hypothetical protein